MENQQCIRYTICDSLQFSLLRKQRHLRDENLTKFGKSIHFIQFHKLVNVMLTSFLGRIWTS